MLVSIVIPVYNRAEMVKDTLESVRRQTHRPIQLILVDNNSSDNTLQVLYDFKAKNETSDFLIDVLEEKRQGASVARNTGSKQAKAEWLMFFDSDDTMDDCLVSKYVEKIKQEEVDLVITTIEYIYKNKKIRSFLAYDNYLPNHIFHTCLSTERYIVRKYLFECAGGWNESLSYWDDWELGIRILLQEPRISVVDDGVYVHVHVHSESITGESYSEKNELAKGVLECAVDLIEQSNHDRKGQFLKYLIYKKVLLAGLYMQEGQKKLSKELFGEVCRELRGQMWLKVFYWLMYKYVCLGGRGSQRIVKHLVK